MAKRTSPNPAGRPRGIRDARLRRLDLFFSNEERLQRVLLDQALTGDVRAAKVIADRIWPKRRPESPPIAVQTKGDSLSGRGRQLVSAALDGRVSADVLALLMKSFESLAQLEAIDELKDRIAVLERARQEMEQLHQLVTASPHVGSNGASKANGAGAPRLPKRTHRGNGHEQAG